ncbi:hypothetical protein OTU49_014128 [Cherax quadricarinatus]|uniref:Uncharacterized protein n=1 Tax=Cherax quadricarinatus TaxID=27406 RepID=A0AAW0YHY5_CHEQU
MYPSDTLSVVSLRPIISCVPETYSKMMCPRKTCSDVSLRHILSRCVPDTRSYRNPTCSASHVALLLPYHYTPRAKKKKKKKKKEKENVMMLIFKTNHLELKQITRG